MNERNSPYFRYAYNALIKDKGVNIALAVLLILSAFLMVTGSMVMERSIGSVDQLFEEAKPPHYLQMHKGDYDPDALTRFASDHPEIDAWLVEEMLGFDSAAIAWHRPSTGESGDLADSLIDNLFVTQQEEFDFLIDETGAIPQASRGEVYVPVAYQQSFGLQAGDKLAIRTDTGIHDLRIRGFVRDSQMASSLSSATRFLVSEADFQELGRAGGGTPEIIAEYRLTDPSLASEFQRAYEGDKALPKNGQAVTYQMIRLVNAFSDGLVAVAMVFLSLLLIAIALLSLRFVIRGTLEEEVREIGVMKAIGLPDQAIVSLYLSKYRVMTLLACIIGGVLAVIASGLLTRSIQVNYAQAPVGLTTILVPVLALLSVYLFVIAICRGVLRGVRKVQVVNALVHGSTLHERQTARHAKRQARRARRTSLASYRGRSISRRLAFSDLRAESGQWVLIPIVFFLGTVLMTLPLNLLSTFESPRFVTYMGAPESDVRADLQFSKDVDSVRADVLSSMRSDGQLTQVRVFANELYEIQEGEGWETLRVEVGDYSGATVEFLEGGRPEPGQIALSVLNANRFQLSTGSKLTIRHGGESATVVVSGIYQDVTSGGHTAKMQGEVTTGASGYVIYANTVDRADPAAVAAQYSERFPAATVIPMREYVQQTLSHTTGAFRSAAIMSFIFGIGVAVVITGLFLKLRLTRERRKMGILSAIGFSMGEIVAQVKGKALLTMAAGTLLGLGFVATGGESLVGLFISLAGLGIANLSFIPNLLLVYVAYPVILVGAGYLGAVVLTARLHGADKSLWLRA
ncbi:ABC transporter permease [Nonomuraea turkmeniaca]|uniref:ABC transporter permease n=1 Tax=Nonomuraea turkmeniaca TaxID=103838 RepID=A0A5S4EVX8_9ACTN|nr:ABC transporter permease [Nonomuraea turkmeniaca]TMR07779.1 ABC transporter permease [Nonomuraea turkmeniaca]